MALENHTIVCALCKNSAENTHYCHISAEDKNLNEDFGDEIILDDSAHNMDKTAKVCEANEVSKTKYGNDVTTISCEGLFAASDGSSLKGSEEGYRGRLVNKYVGFGSRKTDGSITDRTTIAAEEKSSVILRAQAINEIISSKNNNSKSNVTSEQKSRNGERKEDIKARVEKRPSGPGDDQYASDEKESAGCCESNYESVVSNAIKALTAKGYGVEKSDSDGLKNEKILEVQANTQKYSNNQDGQAYRIGDRKTRLLEETTKRDADGTFQGKPARKGRATEHSVRNYTMDFSETSDSDQDGVSAAMNTDELRPSRRRLSSSLVRKFNAKAAESACKPVSRRKSQLSANIKRLQDQLKQEVQEGSKARGSSEDVSNVQQLQQQILKKQSEMRSTRTSSSRSKSRSKSRQRMSCSRSRTYRAPTPIRKERPYRHWHGVANCVTTDSRFIINNTSTKQKTQKPEPQNKQYCDDESVDRTENKANLSLTSEYEETGLRFSLASSISEEVDQRAPGAKASPQKIRIKVREDNQSENSSSSCPKVDIVPVKNTVQYSGSSDNPVEDKQIELVSSGCEDRMHINLLEKNNLESSKIMPECDEASCLSTAIKLEDRDGVNENEDSYSQEYLSVQKSTNKSALKDTVGKNVSTLPALLRRCEEHQTGDHMEYISHNEFSPLMSRSERFELQPKAPVSKLSNSDLSFECSDEKVHQPNSPLSKLSNPDCGDEKVQNPEATLYKLSNPGPEFDCDDVKLQNVSEELVKVPNSTDIPETGAGDLVNREELLAFPKEDNQSPLTTTSIDQTELGFNANDTDFEKSRLPVATPSKPPRCAKKNNVDETVTQPSCTEIKEQSQENDLNSLTSRNTVNFEHTIQETLPLKQQIGSTDRSSHIREFIKGESLSVRESFSNNIGFLSETLQKHPTEEEERSISCPPHEPSSSSFRYTPLQFPNQFKLSSDFSSSASDIGPSIRFRTTIPSREDQRMSVRTRRLREQAAAGVAKDINESSTETSCIQPEEDGGFGESLKSLSNFYLSDKTFSSAGTLDRKGGRRHMKGTQNYILVQAIKDHVGCLPGQLTFRKGQVIKQRCQNQSRYSTEPEVCYGYYRAGRLRKKRKGLYLASCVVPIEE